MLVESWPLREHSVSGSLLWENDCEILFNIILVFIQSYLWLRTYIWLRIFSIYYVIYHSICLRMVIGTQGWSYVKSEPGPLYAQGWGLPGGCASTLPQATSLES